MGQRPLAIRVSGDDTYRSHLTLKMVELQARSPVTIESPLALQLCLRSFDTARSEIRASRWVLQKCFLSSSLVGYASDVVRTTSESVIQELRLKVCFKMSMSHCRCPAQSYKPHHAPDISGRQVTPKVYYLHYDMFVTRLQ